VLCSKALQLSSYKDILGGYDWNFRISFSEKVQKVNLSFGHVRFSSKGRLFLLTLLPDSVLFGAIGDSP